MRVRRPRLPRAHRDHSVRVGSVLLAVLLLPWFVGPYSPFGSATAPASLTHRPAPASVHVALRGSGQAAAPSALPSPAGAGLLRSLPTGVHLAPGIFPPTRLHALPRLASLVPPAAKHAPLPRSGTNVVVNGSEVLMVGTNLSIGSLTVKDHGVVIVENGGQPVQLQVNGNVLLEGSGALLLNASSTLVVNETYDNEWSFEALNNSTLFALGANLSANGHQWVGVLLGNANVTVLASNFGYPNSWFPVDVAGDSSLWVDNSYFLSDIELYDTSFLPSTARVTLNGSIGMNLWTHFRAGESANLSFPGPLRYENWSFPGSYNVSGVGYQVAVTSSYVGAHAVYLWAGSNVSVHNTTGLAIAFAPTNGSLALSGLREGFYPSLALADESFSLTLYRTSVLTWNFYPDATASLRLTSSQVGEIIAAGNASVVVVNSNLTGDGGYYSALGSARLAIYNTRMSDELIAGGTGAIYLVNSSDNSRTPRELLATDRATITSVDLQLGLGVAYAVQAEGSIYVEWNITVSAAVGTVPAAGAEVRASWAPNGTLAATSVTDPNGNTNITLLHKVLRPTGTTFENNYAVSAASGWNLSEAPVTVLRRASVVLELLPLVSTTVPRNGAWDVPLGTNPSFAFSFPMDPASTAAALLVTPGLATTASWSAGGTNLTLAPTPSLAPDTTYSITLGPGAQTASGLALPGTFTLLFHTVALPGAPLLAVSNPSAGATGVAPTSNFTLSFSTPMDPASTEAAFAISPAVPSGTLTVLGADLSWSHGAPLAYNTTYTITVGTNARSTAGIPLGSPIQFQFRTAPAPSTNVRGPANGVTPAPALLPFYVAIVAALLVAALALLWANLRRVSAGRFAPLTPQPPWQETTPTAELPPAWRR
ncbi:MAG: Ig-like domain-containing protein [Thermoplasmata archaeon]|nr:Ig-like domain-containing protein [Thermoplasmata archaeon]